VSEFFVFGGEYSEGGDHEVACIRFGVSPAGCSWESAVWASPVVEEDFECGVFGFFDELFFLGVHVRISPAVRIRCLRSVLL